MSAQLTCRICAVPYDDGPGRVPRILGSCGHSLCEECAYKIHARNEIVCPFCRVKTDVDQGDVSGLLKNYSLVEEPAMKIPKLEINQAPPSGKCTENPAHEAALHCQQCDVDLCGECWNTVHASNSLANHPRIPFSEKPLRLPKCDEHPYNTADLQCVTCPGGPFLMCHTCSLMGAHKGHLTSFVKVEYERHMQELQAHNKKLISWRKEGEKKKTLLTNLNQSFLNNEDSAMDHYLATVRAIRDTNGPVLAAIEKELEKNDDALQRINSEKKSVIATINGSLVNLLRHSKNAQFGNFADALKTGEIGEISYFPKIIQHPLPHIFKMDGKTAQFEYKLESNILNAVFEENIQKVTDQENDVSYWTVRDARFHGIICWKFDLEPLGDVQRVTVDLGVSKVLSVGTISCYAELNDEVLRIRSWRSAYERNLVFTDPSKGILKITVVMIAGVRNPSPDNVKFLYKSPEYPGTRGLLVTVTTR